MRKQKAVLPEKIYALCVGGYIKIGTSRDVQSRLRCTQTHHARRVDLLGVWPGGEKEETEAHSDLLEFHVRGEWFKDTPEVRRYIARRRVLDPDWQYYRSMNALVRERFKKSINLGRPFHPGER